MPNVADSKRRILYVAKYIMENHDEIYPGFSTNDVLDYLVQYGIKADRRSIYSDLAALRDVFEMDIETVPGGYHYLRSRAFEYADLCLLADCTHAAKFLSDAQAKQLIDTIGSFGSLAQAEKLKQEVFLCHRVKGEQKNTMYIISIIREAIEQKKKIQFRYTRRHINNVTERIERNLGRRYTVSPYSLIISDGNYYVYAFSDTAQDMRLFRIDRMKDLEPSNAPQSGFNVYSKIDMSRYIKRVFFMSPGEAQQVKLRFDMKLLDSVIDRLGTDTDVMYRPDGKEHFVVTTEIEISNQFYGWLASFGTRAQILYPEKVINDFSHYLADIIQSYSAKE